MEILSTGQLIAGQERTDEVVRKSQEPPKDKDKMRTVARDFASLFLDMMLGSMRQTVPKDGLIKGGNAEDIYRSMLDSEYAKIMAKQDASGLAGMVEKQMQNIAGRQHYAKGG